MLTKLSLAASVAVLACLCQSAPAATLPPVVLAWNQNPEPDIVGYEVKYGTVSGVHGTTVSAGLNTSVSVSGLTEGETYYFVLIAINKDGLESGTVEISYTGVLPASNQAPQSTISAPSADVRIAEGDVVYFAGDGSDPEAKAPLTYLWNFGSGSGIEDSSSRRPRSRRFDIAGTHVVTFTVTNSLGLADSTPARRTITVLPPAVANQPPESTISSPASDVSITVGGTLNFSGSGSDPDGDASLTYHWNFGSDSGFADSTSETPGNRRFNTVGTYLVTLTVSDSLGLADSTPATRTITVSPPNQAPESTISEPPSDIIITEGGVIYFAGSGTDPDGNMPLTYHWDFGGESGIEDANLASPGTRIFDQAGTYLVTFTASDSLGLADQAPAMRTITVLPSPPSPIANQAPESMISAPSSDVTITAGQAVEFAGTGSDPDGNTPLAYLWSFGDESGISDSTSENPGMVRFDKPGIYQVSLSVTDSKGLVDPSPAQRTVTVNAGVNRAPFSMISEPASNLTITAGEFVTFSGIGDDPDGDVPLTYLWDFSAASGIENSISDTPGSKRFDTPGTYEVSFTVTDSKGLADSTPAVRTVIVLAAEESVPGLEGWITSPESDLTISAGETVWFTGSGINNYRWGTLNYRWNFGVGSGISDSKKKRPEAVRFNNPGTYVVTFTVINPKGVADPSPARVTVTVTGAARMTAMANAAEAQPVMAKETIDGASYLTFTVTKPTVGQNFNSIVEVSSDLKTWHSGSGHLTVITDDERILKVRTKNPISGTPCCFFRLKTPPQAGSTSSKPEL